MRLLPLLASLAALATYAPTASAQSPDILRIGIRDDPDILDPTFSRTYVGTVVMTALCDKLFDFDAKLNIVPVLASSFLTLSCSCTILFETARGCPSASACCRANL